MVTMDDAALHRVRVGDIAFAKFVRESRSQWDRIANDLLQRWDTPRWIEHRDVVQQLLLSAWFKLWRWTPESGITLAQYVVWHSISDTRKLLHKARLGRRLHRGEERERSNYELTESRLGALPLGISPAEQEQAVLIRQMFRVAAESAENDAIAKKHRYCLRMLADTGGDIAQAAELLYDDATARYVCKLKNPQHAERMLRQAAAGVVNKHWFSRGQELTYDGNEFEFEQCSADLSRHLAQ